MTTTLTLARPLTAWELRATSPKARQQMKALLDEYTDAPALCLSARRWARDYSSAKRNTRHATRCRRKKTPSMAAADRRLPMTMLHWGSASNSHSPRTAIRAWTWPRAARGDPCQRRAVSGRRGDSRRSSSGDLPHVLGDRAAGSDVRETLRAASGGTRRARGSPGSGGTSMSWRDRARAVPRAAGPRARHAGRPGRAPPRLLSAVLHAIEAGVFHPNPGWQCKDRPFSEPVLGVAVGARRRGRR